MMRGILTYVSALGLAIVAVPTADAANVSGRVTTPQGIGIPGIDIDVIDAAGVPVEILDDDTDADGSFDFLVPDGRYRVRFQASPSLPLVSLEFQNWLLEGVVTWDLVMETGAFITGTVRDPGGTPLAAVKLDIEREDREADVHAPDDETAGDGTFSVVVPFDAPILLTLEPPAGNAFLAMSEHVGPFSGDTSLGDFTLETGHRVSGRVLTGGTPVDRANLDAIGSGGVEVPLAHDRTGVDGRYEIVVPAGTYEIVAKPRIDDALAPARSAPVAVTSDVDIGDLTVEAGRTLSGRVSDESSGDGVADARVRALLGDAPIDVSGGAANGDGEYWLVAPPGVYDVAALAPAFRMLEPDTVEAFDLNADAMLNLELVASMTPIAGVTAILAEREGTTVRLSWRVVGLARYDGFRLLRTVGAGPIEPLHEGWLRPGSAVEGFTFEGSAFVGTFLYTDAVPTGAAVVYWLEARSPTGSIESEGPITPIDLTPTGAVAAAHLRVQPNPLNGRDVVFRAPAGARRSGASLTLFDVTGRRVAAFGASEAIVTGDDIVWRVSLPERGGSRATYVLFARARVGNVTYRAKLVRLAPTP